MSYMIYNAVFTAFYNVNRRKHKPALKLYRRRPGKVDKAETKDDLNAVLESQKNDGDWVRRLYEANGYVISTEVKRSGNTKRKNNR